MTQKQHLPICRIAAGPNVYCESTVTGGGPFSTRAVYRPCVICVDIGKEPVLVPNYRDAYRHLRPDDGPGPNDEPLITCKEMFIHDHAPQGIWLVPHPEG